MLNATAGDRFAARLGLTLFDLLALGVSAVLLALIALTAALTLRPAEACVIFLKMDSRDLYELWIADPDAPQDAVQILQTEGGVYEYDVSPDGRYIVYSQMNYRIGGRDLSVLDLTTGESVLIAACTTQDADCYAPKFRPTGNMIAYERTSLSTGSAYGIGAARIWLIDLSASPPTTFPVVEDDGTMLGTGATWSDDGSKLAFYDNNAAQIVVYDLASGAIDLVRTGMGVTGDLSPDGRYLLYPDIAVSRGIMRLFDTETNLLRDVSNPAELHDEQYARWSPEGRYAAIGRRPGDMRGTQIYLLDTADFSVTPLLVDTEYNHSAFQWRDDGEALVMTRFRQFDENGDPYNQGTLEVWTYNTETRILTRITEVGAFGLNPQWVTPPRNYARIDPDTLPTPAPTIDRSF